MFMLLQLHVICICIPLSPGQVLVTNLWGTEERSCNESKTPILKVSSFSSSQRTLGRDSDGERHKGSRDASESQDSDMTHVACASDENISWACIVCEKKSKLRSSYCSGCFRQHAPAVCSCQQASLSHLYVPHFLPPRGFGICCSLCLEACLLSPFPRKGFLTLQISGLHVSSPPASPTRSSLPFTGSHRHPFFVSLVAPYFLVRLRD